MSAPARDATGWPIVRSARVVARLRDERLPRIHGVVEEVDDVGTVRIRQDHTHHLRFARAADCRVQRRPASRP